MSDGTNILLILAGVMLATTLFVVVLVLFARWLDWSISVVERWSALLISCEYCGAPLSFKGQNCKSCGKPVSQALLKKYKLRMLVVFSFWLAILVLLMGNIFVAAILSVLGLVFLGYERHYEKIIRDSKDGKKA